MNKEIPQIRFIRLAPNAVLPSYETAEAAGADVRSTRTVIMEPHSHGLIPTGLGCVIPAGWEIQVRPRSGLAWKWGVTVLNSPGTVDSDYSGELCVMLHNTRDESFRINEGERIAQIVVAPSYRADFGWIGEARQTDRGSSGFGSTGTK